MKEVDFKHEEIRILRFRLDRLARDSTTSHRPPSSCDVFRKKRGRLKRGSSGRKPGGQKGHRGITRSLVVSERVSETVVHLPPNCNTSQILEPICQELEEELPRQGVLNIDETSYPHNKTLAWLWAFVTSSFVFFTIQSSRGSKVIQQTIGKAFDGIIICDRFSAYVKYHKERACGWLQPCVNEWASFSGSGMLTKMENIHARNSGRALNP